MKRVIIDSLLKWKGSESRKPLIIRGARQIGKSYIIGQFGKLYFDNLVTVNLDLSPEMQRCFDSLQPKENLAQLSAVTGQTIIPGKTLLFIDEIQNSTQAIKALRYYKEQLPELHVIAAGSLLEFVLNEEDFSFPVGRLQFLYMYPMSFNEFILSQDNQQAIDYIHTASIKDKIPQPIHEYLLKQVRVYFLTGGMPEVVNAYSDPLSFTDCELIQTSIIDTYRHDFGKYAKGAEIKYLQKFYENAPNLVAKQFKFSHLDPNIRTRELRPALEKMCQAGLFSQVFATSATGVPLRYHIKENKFKLLMLDIGLLQRANCVNAAEIYQQDLIQLNQGMLAEQFVGQEIIASHNPYEERRVYYWQRDKRNSLAEVDYVVRYNDQIVPIEVKAGKTGRLRSLHQFMQEKNTHIGVRVSQQPLELEKGILSIPFYLVSQLGRLYKEL